MPDRQHSELSLQNDKTFYNKWDWSIERSYQLYYNITAAGRTVAF